MLMNRLVAIATLFTVFTMSGNLPAAAVDFLRDVQPVPAAHEWIEWTGDAASHQHWGQVIKLPDGGNVLAQHCLKAGCGVRDGFTEPFNRFAWRPDWGLNLVTEGVFRYSVMVKVTYLDDHAGEWRLEYDAGAAAVWKKSKPVLNIQDGKWKTIPFQRDDAAFENRQRGWADFRIANDRQHDLTVHFVRLIKTEAPARPQAGSKPTPP